MCTREVGFRQRRQCGELPCPSLWRTFWDFPGSTDRISYVNALYVGMLKAMHFIGIVVNPNSQVGDPPGASEYPLSRHREQVRAGAGGREGGCEGADPKGAGRAESSVLPWSFLCECQ